MQLSNYSLLLCFYIYIPMGDKALEECFITKCQICEVGKGSSF